MRRRKLMKCMITVAILTFAFMGQAPSLLAQDEELFQKIERLKQLKETNPEAYQKAIQKRKSRLQSKLEDLKQNNPDKLQKFQQRNQQFKRKRLQNLKQNNPEKFEQLKSRRMQNLRERAQKNPEKFQRMMQNNPRLKEKFERFNQRNTQGTNSFQERARNRVGERNPERFKQLRENNLNRTERIERNGEEQPGFTEREKAFQKRKQFVSEQGEQAFDRKRVGDRQGIQRNRNSNFRNRMNGNLDRGSQNFRRPQNNNSGRQLGGERRRR